MLIIIFHVKILIQLINWVSFLNIPFHTILFNVLEKAALNIIFLIHIDFIMLYFYNRLHQLKQRCLLSNRWSSLFGHNNLWRHIWNVFGHSRKLRRTLIWRRTTWGNHSTCISVIIFKFTCFKTYYKILHFLLKFICFLFFLVHIFLQLFFLKCVHMSFFFFVFNDFCIF